MTIRTKALSIATSATIWLIAVLTIWSELSKPLKDFLAGISGHHWVTKGIASAVFFVLFYFILAKFLKETDDVKKEVSYALWSAILGGLAILTFYLWHFFA